MPYIKKEAREVLKKNPPTNLGELAYSITHHYLKKSGKSRLRFSDYARIIGEIAMVESIVASCLKSSNCLGARLKVDIEDLYLTRASKLNLNESVVTVLGLIVQTLGYFSAFDIFDITGVVRCVHDEFYRRKVAPYEDKAIDKNGDVF